MRGCSKWAGWSGKGRSGAGWISPDPPIGFVELPPDFGQIDTCHRGKRLLLRGSAAAEAELAFMAACHNIPKLVGFTDNASRATR
jgi:hypothetical protein